MDSFELNKIAGAILGTLVIALGLGIASDIIFEPDMPETPGYLVEVPEEGETEVAEAEGQGEPLPVLLAAATVEAGESQIRKCASCHTFEQGGGNKVGPNLWGVVARLKGAVPGFSYSEELAAAQAEGQTWTFEELNTFIENPRARHPGTTMAFAGLKSPEDRAAVITYLRSLSEDPVPLPEVEEVPDTGLEPGNPASPGVPTVEGDGALSEPLAPVGTPAEADEQPAAEQPTATATPPVPGTPGAAAPVAPGTNLETAAPTAPAASPAGTTTTGAGSPGAAAAPEPGQQPGGVQPPLATEATPGTDIPQGNVPPVTVAPVTEASPVVVDPAQPGAAGAQSEQVVVPPQPTAPATPTAPQAAPTQPPATTAPAAPTAPQVAPTQAPTSPAAPTAPTRQGAAPTQGNVSPAPGGTGSGTIITVPIQRVPAPGTNQ